MADLKAVAERAIAFCDGGIAESIPDNLDLLFSPSGLKAEFKGATVGAFSNDLAAEATGKGMTVCVGARMMRTILDDMASEEVGLYLSGPITPMRLEPAAEAPREVYILMPRTTPEVKEAPGAEADKDVAD